MRKNVYSLLGAMLILLIGSVSLYAKKNKDVSEDRNLSGNYNVIAYVTSDRKGMPDPNLVTHIFYAFAEVKETFDGIDIINPERFQQIVDLKKINPDLKISISVGGYRRAGFSEMSSSGKLRKAFVKDCKEKIEKYGLDGIDLDWEFPTTDKGGHTARPDDAVNYGKLVKELRKALGKEKLITFYSNNSGAFIDFDEMLPYVDFVMASGYNLGIPPKHHSNLYPSKFCGGWSVSGGMKRHIGKGVPPSKIMMGVPFYARSIPFEGKYKYFERSHFSRFLKGYEIKWDDEAKAPYAADENGEMLASFDNEESIGYKAEYIKDNGFAGMFYWHADSDDENHSLARSAWQNMMK